MAGALAPVSGTGKACGHPSCSSSSALDERLTFGRGRLDEHGYWSRPCRPCAEQWDQERPALVEEWKPRLMAENGLTTDEQFDEFLRREHGWLVLPAWPLR